MLFKIISVCKGGGYRYCRTEPVHPKANSKGLYPLHRVLVENKLGRLLRDDEDVHHKDENKENDSIENLQHMTRSEHARLHRPTLEPVEMTCPCGKKFQLRRHAARQRTARAKGPICCSRSCSGRFGHERRNTNRTNFPR